MKNVLLKALNRASQKQLSVEETADLIIDYLDIAGEIKPTKESTAQTVVEPPPVVAPQKQKVVDINRAVNPKRPPGVPAWKTDELFNYLSKFDMAFQVQPQGWDRDVAFRAGLTKDPNNMKGIGVVWQAVEDPQFKLNYFFSVETETPNVEEAIEEVKKSVDNILRRVDKPITNSTVPLRAIPSDIASMAGFSATV